MRGSQFNSVENEAANDEKFSTQTYKFKLEGHHYHGHGIKSKLCHRYKLFGFIIALLVLAIIVLIGTLIFMERRNSMATYSTDDKCLSAACVEAAARLYKSMDHSINPCDNFYQFTCGGWHRNHIVPDDSAHVSNFGVLRDQVSIMMKHIIEKQITSHDLPTTRICKTLYKSCMNRKQLEREGVKTLLSTARIMNGLPIITPNYNSSLRAFEDIYSQASLYGIAGNPFAFSVNIDAKNSSLYRLRFDQPAVLFLPSLYYYKNQSLYKTQINAYTKFMTAMLHLLRVEFNATDYISDKRVDEIAHNVLQFEITIANATTPLGLRRKIEDQYNLTTLKMMHTMFPMFNWTQYLYKVFNNADISLLLRSDEIVDLSSFSFFNTVKHVLFDVKNKETLSYLHLFYAIKGVLQHLPKKYRNIYYTYTEAVFGTSAEKPRFKVCYNIVNSMLPHAVGRMFIDEHFSESAKLDTVEMIQRVKQSFDDLLVKNTWMDMETKNAAKEKVRLIRDKMAYPDWTKNDTQLYEFYKDVNITHGDFMNDMFKLLKRVMSHFLTKYLTSVDKSVWISSAAVVNAYYMPPYNTITFPAAILQPPFYDNLYPKYLNYGAIGVVIGHEITHGFDDQGRERDGNGNYRPWWESSSILKFNKQAQCLIQQYGNFTVPNGMNLNGVQTQGENIADNGGIKQAFLSYRKWVEQQGREEKGLPGLNYTSDQLFFINFGYIWCHKERSSEWRTRILNGVHSPGTYRVIGSVQNSEDFARVFGCKPNDKMNPVKKCSVW